MSLSIIQEFLLIFIPVSGELLNVVYYKALIKIILIQACMGKSGMRYHIWEYYVEASI